MFKKHHYLDGNLLKTSDCYVGLYDNKIVVFYALIQFPGIKGAKRIHRLVTLPEYQGLGIGTKFSDAIAKMYVDKGWEVYMTTSNKGLANSLLRNKHWKLNNKTLNAPFFDKKINGKFFNSSKESLNKLYKRAFKRIIYSFKTNKDIW